MLFGFSTNLHRNHLANILLFKNVFVSITKDFPSIFCKYDTSTNLSLLHLLFLSLDIRRFRRILFQNSFEVSNNLKKHKSK